MKLTLLMAALLATSAAHADVVTAKGKASVKYTERSVNAESKERAVFAAQMKAIEMYFAEAGDAQAENLDAIRETIRKDPERFILESTTLQEDDRTDLHQYTAVVRVSLNGSNLRNALKKASPVGAAGEKSQLAFVLVSRQVDAQTSFDARVTKRAVVTANGQATASRSEKGSEGEAVGASKVSTNANKNVKASYAVERGVTVETGGSTVQRADQSTWKLIPSQNLNSVITQIFKTSGYRVVDAAFVEPMTNGTFKVAEVENDYRNGNDLKSGTLATVVNGMRIAKVRYVALGTLDVGQAGTDPATGLMRVAVTANAKVLDLGQGIPETVAVAGPAQYAGTGPTEDEARTNALKIAAQTVSRELTSQLANAGLR
ncbi:hypothetical protein [Massilia sp. S19_KUP03_FR1]|uniref:hypothetical protein n=1 Tax=Massilia sp. S19_KUP03_FR1 TaxID=3025503 RepID=UPI002FCD8608